MATKIFVNLPVKDLKRTISFFTDLGYSFNMQFTNDDGACMVLSDSGYVMLLPEPRFKEFTPKEIADAKKTTEVLIALDESSRDAVDARMANALSLGASEARDAQDHGFMYSRAFEDLDGHIWEIFWMDQSQITQ